MRDKLAQLEQQLAAGQQGGKTTAEPGDLNIIAFNLAPQTRGVGPITTLDVPAETDYVALTLTLEANGFSRVPGSVEESRDRANRLA